MIFYILITVASLVYVGWLFYKFGYAMGYEARMDGKAPTYLTEGRSYLPLEKRHQNA